MNPARIRVKWRRTVVALTLALGVIFPPPARAYLLDFTVASLNPGCLISHAAGFPLTTPAVGSHLQAADFSPMGDLGPQPRCTIALHNSIFNFPTGPLMDYFSTVPSAPLAWRFSGISPPGSIPPQSGLPGLDRSDGRTLLNGSLRSVSVKEPAPVSEDWLFYVAGSNVTDNKNDGLLTFSGIYRQAADDIPDPGCGVSFAFAPGGFAGATASSGNILHHLAPFSSTLLLLGCGLMGLVGLRCRRRRG